MSVTVRIPTTLRSHTDGQRQVQLDQRATIRDVLEELFDRYPDLRPRIMDTDGTLVRWINVFYGQINVRDLEDGLDAKVLDEDSIQIMPAVAGG